MREIPLGDVDSVPAHELISIRQAASEIGVTKRTIYNWVRLGKFKVYYVGDLMTIRRHDVTMFVNGRKHAKRARAS